MDISDTIAKQIGHLTLEIFKRDATIHELRGGIERRDEQIKKLALALKTVQDQANEPKLPLPASENGSAKAEIKKFELGEDGFHRVKNFDAGGSGGGNSGDKIIEVEGVGAAKHSGVH